MQSPRRSDRSTKGVPPLRFGRESWLRRAGSNPDLCSMSVETGSTPTSGSETDSLHDRTIVQMPRNAVSQQPDAVGQALDDTQCGLNEIEHIAGVSAGSSRRSSMGGSRNSARSNQSGDMLHLLELNTRVLQLHDQLETRERERRELVQSRLQVEEAFAAYKRQHEAAMRDADSGACSMKTSVTTTTSSQTLAWTSTSLSSAPVSTTSSTSHIILSTPDPAMLGAVGGPPADSSFPVRSGLMPRYTSYPNATSTHHGPLALSSAHGAHQSAQAQHAALRHPSSAFASIYTPHSMHAQHTAYAQPSPYPQNPAPTPDTVTYAPLSTVAHKAPPSTVAFAPPSTAAPAPLPSTISYAQPSLSTRGYAPPPLSTFACAPPSNIAYAPPPPSTVAYVPSAMPHEFGASLPHAAHSTASGYVLPMPPMPPSFGASLTHAAHSSAYAMQPSAAPAPQHAVPAPAHSIPALSPEPAYAMPPHANYAIPQYAPNGMPSSGVLGFGNGVVHQPQRRLHDLPEFSGRPEQWPMFYSSFHHTTVAYGYSQLENQSRLQKSVCGEAKQAIECLLIYPQHVDMAIARLSALYGRPEQLVRSQISRARELPAITEEHIVELIAFATTVQNVALFLDTPETHHYLTDNTLLEELIRKLPMGRRENWAAEAARLGHRPTLMDFARWVTGVADFIGQVSYEADKQPPRSSSKTSAKRHVLLNVEENAEIEPLQCTFCSGRHEITRCSEFLNLSVNERWQEVKTKSICFGCLGVGHILPSCEKKRKCGLDGCDRWHNRKLHTKADPQSQSSGRTQPSRKKGGRSVFKNRLQQPAVQADAQPQIDAQDGDQQPLAARACVRQRPAAAADEQQQQAARAGDHHRTSEEVVSTINHCHEVQRKSTLLFRVVPVSIHGPNGDVSAFALLDEGSSITLVDADLADDLGLQGPTSKLSVHWFSANSSVQESRRVSFDVTGQQAGCVRYNLQNVRTIKNLSLPAQTVDAQTLIETSPHLRTVPFVEYTDAKPKILVGLDHHHLGVPSEIRANAEQRGIVAAKTPLGWVIYGSDGPAPLPRAEVLHIHDAEDDKYEQLNQLVRSHFSTEAFGTKVSEAVAESDETRRARQILHQTTRRISDNRFEVGLLWKTPDTCLPPSYQMALRRLRSVEARMHRDPAFRNQYNAQIEAYIEKGYARRLSNDEARSVCKRSWFLPHFAVFNANKPGKFRLVFDAAATVGDISLNSELLSGPDINTALVRLLMQFRTGEVGIVADIREMFHQVRIRKEDQVAQKFLWRFGDSTAEPGVYAMEVMTFGATCSPASAQHIKNINAAQFADEYPEAAAAIQTRHYVDDYVASFSTAEEAASVSADVVRVHQRGGFDLRGFKSNSRKAMELLGADTGSGAGDTVSLQLEQCETEKVLGMCWNTDVDAFQFRTKFIRVQPAIINGLRTPTKREVLSVSMSIFDPYGLLADFMLESKLILQDLWRIGVDWDTPIPERFAKRWEQWRQEVERTKLLMVPRCYSRFIKTSTDVQLHIYADASESAFSAVAYWRVVHPDGIDVAFVLARARCAPLQILTIPRLELQAAVLATRLLSEIRASHPEISIKQVVLWSDSATVLSWLRSDQRRYKPFVQFRVAEILEATPAACWRWVPTSMNVADDATRVKRPVTFRPDSRWTRGPAWLRMSEEEWPTRSSPIKQEDADDDAHSEIRRNFVGALYENRTIFDYTRFASFRQLCRVTALVRHYISNLQIAQSKRIPRPLDASEIESAMLAQCRLVQKEVYAKEIAALKREDPVERKSDLYPLKAYLASDDLLRMYGRTDAADDQHLPYDSRRPILLPRNHRLTWLLVQEQHEKNAHQLTNATIAAIRRRYWVPQIRTLLRSVQAQCVICKRRTAQPVPPVQGQLPADRLTPYVRPFTSTGLDYFGPVLVTIGRRREKRWVAVFTCLAVRAVHLEIAADLSTDSCLICVRNLCHVRGTPTRIRCDNGTNFVGARNTLDKEDGFIDAAVMQRELCSVGIQWVMNCPGNPEAGGVWERMVQAVKRILAVTLKNEAPRVETLRAHLLEAANMLNSRPLTHISVSPDDHEALTPNHFLIGGPNAVTMTNPTEAEPAWTRKQWRISRELSRRFWTQWINEYLPELTRRTKDYPERKELAVDDIVIVCDTNQPRGRWPIGRIVSVVTGTDGRVRTAEVKTKDGVHRRPVARLAVLDIA